MSTNTPNQDSTLSMSSPATALVPQHVRLPSPTPSEASLLAPNTQAARDAPATPTSLPDHFRPLGWGVAPITQPDIDTVHPELEPLPIRHHEIPEQNPGGPTSRSPSPSIQLDAAPARRQSQPRRPPITSRIRSALGLNTPGASLSWRISFGTTEIIIIGVLLGLAGRPGSVPPGTGVDPNLSQWEACGRPLAPWDVVWGVKTFIGLGMAGWEYWRSVRPSTDQLLAVERARLNREVRRARREAVRASRRSRPGPRSGGHHRGDSTLGSAGVDIANLNGDTEDEQGIEPPARAVVRPPRRGLVRDGWTMGGGREEDLDIIDASMSGSARSMQIVERIRQIRRSREHEERWYTRLTSLLALYSLVWFVTANILLYGSMNTCRYTSPYVWWLTFGLLCLGYIVVAEMLLVALVVFFIGPLVYLTINLVLICLGRQPITPGGRMGHINPDVPKMPRGMVDRIPLVMYIPMPAQDQPTDPTSPTADAAAESQPKPASKHEYPPKPRRFFFFRKKTKTKPEAPKTEAEDDLEAGYEKTGYPFVKLESNRAACAVCLMDFDPPRRVGEAGGSTVDPLRLLACGHVFHKECLDPWLVDVSGRCPTCQRAVEEDDLDPETGGKKNKRRRQRQT